MPSTESMQADQLSLADMAILRRASIDKALSTGGSWALEETPRQMLIRESMASRERPEGIRFGDLSHHTGVTALHDAVKLIPDPRPAE